LNNNVLSIILARGGSKGIIKKNLQIVGGLPMVVHSINQSIESKIINRVVVSTDDEDIDRISKKYGAEVIERPAEISSDKSPSEDALKHVLEFLNKKENYTPDLVVFLQPTSPIRKPGQIDKAINTMLNQNSDSCFSASKEHFTGRWIMNKKGFAEPTNYQLDKRPMRQDYPLHYLENGSLSIFKPNILLKTGCRLGGEIAIFEMDNIESLQIDTKDELALVDEIMRNLNL